MVGDTTDPVAAPLPPADTREKGPDELRREQVDQLVDRCLAPATGLCVRVLDPEGFDAVGRDQASEVAQDALTAAARKRLAADDEAVHEVFRRVGLIGMDALAGNPGAATLPAGVDLQDLVGTEVSAADVAPDGRLPFAVLLDAVAAARGVDRQVAFVVLAAGLPTADAGMLLGLDTDSVDGSLHRIGRRLAEGHDTGRDDREVA